MVEIGPIALFVPDYGRDWPNLSWRETGFLAPLGIIIVEIGPIAAFGTRLQSRLAQSVLPVNNEPRATCRFGQVLPVQSG